MKREGKTDANRSKGGGMNGKKHEVKKKGDRKKNRNRENEEKEHIRREGEKFWNFSMVCVLWFIIHVMALLCNFLHILFS